MSQKGSRFERFVCGKLSRWWTNGARDDVFWRTAGSGARATNRRKCGKLTKYQDNDVTAIDPVGEPLLKCVLLELKRGYGRDSVANLIEPSERGGVPVYSVWINELRRRQKELGVPGWLLVVKRDQRKVMVWMPDEFWSTLWEHGASLSPFAPVTIVMETDPHYGIVGVPFDNFLNSVPPSCFDSIAKGLSC